MHIKHETSLYFLAKIALYKNNKDRINGEKNVNLINILAISINKLSAQPDKLIFFSLYIKSAVLGTHHFVLGLRDNNSHPPEWYAAARIITARRFTCVNLVMRWTGNPA